MQRESDEGLLKFEVGQTIAGLRGVSWSEESHSEIGTVTRDFLLSLCNKPWLDKVGLAREIAQRRGFVFTDEMESTGGTVTRAFYLQLLSSMRK